MTIPGVEVLTNNPVPSANDKFKFKSFWAGKQANTLVEICT